MSEDLSAKQWRAIACLVNGATLEEASQQAGVHRRTLEKWRDDWYFLQALRGSVRATYETALNRAVDASTEAVRVLKEVMEDKDSSNRDRISAASKILDVASKHIEYDLDLRLAEIEGALEIRDQVQEWEGQSQKR